MRTSWTFLLAALAVLVQGAGSAEAGGAARSTTDYSVRFLGLPIARAAFTTVIDGASYRIDGQVRSAGLAEIFDSTRGTAQVSGVVKPDRLQARSFVMSYRSGGKSSRTEVRLSNGNVQSASQTPKEKPHGEDWIALSRSDLLSVLDPISGLVVPAGTPVCPRTVAVFDGQTRADFVLRPAGRQPFSTTGYRGEAIACTVRFVPKAGYRKGNRSVSYLQKLDTIEVWFARSPSADVYAPVYARVPTKIGSVTVWATRFGG